MPLSKARNRERMRQIRLHAKTDTVLVQPNLPFSGVAMRAMGEICPIRPQDVLTVDTIRNMLETERAQGIPDDASEGMWFDADGNPVYEEG